MTNQTNISEKQLSTYFFSAGTPIKETEKAVYVKARVELIDRDVTVFVWLPKSQIKDGKIPLWLWKAKEQELLQRFRYIQYIEFL